MILLTKEERDEVYDKLPNDITVGEERRAYCKAQLKKVEAWLYMEFKYLTMSAQTLKLLNDIRQALLKEVG